MFDKKPGMDFGTSRLTSGLFLLIPHEQWLQAQ